MPQEREASSISGPHKLLSPSLSSPHPTTPTTLISRPPPPFSCEGSPPSLCSREGSTFHVDKLYLQLRKGQGIDDHHFPHPHFPPFSSFLLFHVDKLYLQLRKGQGIDDHHFPHPHFPPFSSFLLYHVVDKLLFLSLLPTRPHNRPSLPPPPVHVKVPCGQALAPFPFQQHQPHSPPLLPHSFPALLLPFYVKVPRGQAVVSFPFLSTHSPPSSSLFVPRGQALVCTAHVYLWLRKGQGIDDVTPEMLEDCTQLVKANSIMGNKLSNIDVVYTSWANLRKASSMDVEQIGFHNPKAVRSVWVEKRLNEVVVMVLNGLKWFSWSGELAEQDQGGEDA
ncbi:unnamed protein product [Closterium sp. Naga37s-1]|nr:unnamed protein product [Closterium sp. Naga37s-1]